MTHPFNKQPNYDAITLCDHILTVLAKMEFASPAIIRHVKDMLAYSGTTEEVQQMVCHLMDHIQEQLTLEVKHYEQSN